MRCQVFNSRDGTKPVVSARWRWLATMLVARRSMKCDWYDTRTGKTLLERARAMRPSA